MSASGNSMSLDGSFRNLIVKKAATFQDRVNVQDINAKQITTHDIASSTISTKTLGISEDVVVGKSLNVMNGNIEVIRGDVVSGGNIIAGGTLVANTGNVEMNGAASGLVFSEIQSIAEASTTAILNARAGTVVFTNNYIEPRGCVTYRLQNALVHPKSVAIVMLSGNSPTSGLVFGTITYASGFISIPIINSGSANYNGVTLRCTFLLLN